MNPIHERVHDAKIAAAATQTPEELRVPIRAGGQKLTVGRDDIRREQVVAAETVLSHQPTEAAAQGQPGDASSRDDPAGAGQAKGLRFSVVLAPGEAGLSARWALNRIDPDTLHRRQVDHSPALADGA